ncbi:MAG TPA: class I SAM-dependent methyltransferase [Tepidisphaeraceae bacterium]|jgi:SAM-dependent methyltransferase|nr:class I SAM-dependent methyltransferase [Tepidisphaeraceae bacterium]
MSTTRDIAIRHGWLFADEQPRFARLTFPHAGDANCVHVNNCAVRDAVLNDVLIGRATAVANPCFLGGDTDVVIAETDRYGLPLRTVLSLNTGLMRSDPYYSDDYLRTFYTQHYRNLYRPVRFSQPWFLTEQIKHGQRLFERHRANLPRNARVLDVGCGMGGTLVAFKFDGCATVGCDWGDEFTGRGRAIGLDVRTGGFETLANEEPFDLIILSHVLEHTADPVGFCRSLRGLLATDGILHIELPGILNIRSGYDGDLLTYLQNAHLWHFTQATLNATLCQAGLQMVQADETITCVARRGAVSRNIDGNEGARVLAELDRLEQAMTAKVAA